MKVKLTQNLAGKKSGDEIDVPDADAERLIDRGFAEKPAAKKAASKKTD